MSQIKTVWKWGCTQVLRRMLCTISVTVHFLLSILSASPQTTLDAGISAGIRRSELSGDVHMGPEYQAWLPYVLLSLSLPRATCWHWKNRDDTSEMGIGCAILATQKTWLSSPSLGCTGRGKSAALLGSSGGAAFITTWEVVAVSDNSADIRNTCEDSGAHMWPGLHIA